jgi:tetraacyldisaccharide 4'-kinase
MTFKTPAFWYDKTIKPTARQKALRPLSTLYGMVQGANQSLRARDVYTARLPVICVGNITAGGSGKTPTAISIAALLKSQNIAQNPCFLTRGYGGEISGPVLVDLKTHTAKDVGDEALLLARHAPTIVCAKRAEGARFAESQANLGAIIMDDGLQNPTLRQNLRLLVISGELGIGNAQLLPAGPLREPLKDGLSKADAVIITGENRTDIKTHIPAATPIIEGSLRALSVPPKDRKYLAFAGLGMPSKFFDFLRAHAGLDIVKTMEFADHHPYSETDLRNVHAEATALNATLITTEKDSVRLPEIDGIEVLTLPVSMAWNNEPELITLLKALKCGDEK